MFGLSQSLSRAALLRWDGNLYEPINIVQGPTDLHDGKNILKKN
jgi:hypothetical protein